MTKQEKKPNGYWKIEANVRAAASGCVSIGEFRKVSENAYREAIKMGILDDLGLDRPIKPSGYWSIEANVRAAAGECTTIGEFEKIYGRAYHKALEMGIIDDLGLERLTVPMGHWKIEANVRAAAAECTTIGEFRISFNYAYYAAHKMGILDDLGLDRPIKPSGYWKIESNVRAAASECATIKEFSKRFSRAYKKALEMKILDDLGLERSIMPMGHWEIEVNVRVAASECATLTDFENRFTGASSNARKMGIIDDLGLERAQMPRNHWKIEANIRAAAAEFVTLDQFNKMSSVAYYAAHKMGIIDDLGLERSQMTPGHWQIEANVRAAASECATIKEFNESDSTACQAARDMGIIDDLGFERSEMPKGYWNIEANIREAAAQCVTRSEFKKRFGSAHHNALERGIIDDLGLEPAAGGFDTAKPGILYYLKVTHRGRIYYKIGITNRTVELRYNVEDLQKIEVLKIKKYKLGAACKTSEQSITAKHAAHLYKGKATPLIGAIGNTELFKCDVMGWDK